MIEQVDVLIVGAGGHGQVVADILLAAYRAGSLQRPVGFVDDDVRLADRSFLGLPVKGRVADVRVIKHGGIVVAIGENDVRRTIFERLLVDGDRLVCAIHPSAVIGQGVEIGAGSVVCAGAIVNPGCRVGSNVILNTGSIIEHHCSVGDHAHVAPRACLGGEASIGEGVLAGIGSVLLPGRRVGQRSVIGAGAVVAGDVAPGVVVAGVPARVLRTV